MTSDNQPTPTTQDDRLIKRANLTYQLTVLSLLGLLLLFPIWFFAFSATEHPWTITAIHLVPLLMFVPGLMQRRPRVFAWLCFVILLYFCQGVMNAFALPELLGKIGMVETVLCVVLFCSAMMAARYHGQLVYR